MLTPLGPLHLRLLGPNPTLTLVINLFLRNTVAGAASDSPCSWAFHNGICEAQFVALRG